MRQNKQFASGMAAALAVAALVGTSAFAETRHSKETDAQAKSGGVASIESLSGDESRNEGRSETRRGDRSDDRRGDRNYDRNRDRDGNRNDRNRNDRYRNNRNDRNDRNDRYRNDRDDRNRNDRYRNDRNQSNRNRSYRSEHRQPYYAHGRVSRVHRHGRGYRVYVHGARYPFFVPDRYYHRDRFRIGLSIRLGGYYNPGGYYDYYDGRYASSRADLTGVVESVDYRRNTFVMRNDATGSFVTVFMRDRDARRELRSGDYVEVYGDWSRNGLFQAYDIDLLDRY